MLFPTGRIAATPGVLEAIPRDVMIAALRRHLRGDWGNLDEEDRRTNDQAVKDGTRVLSAYRHGEVAFWVVTEADRSCTTFLLPEDY